MGGHAEDLMISRRDNDAMLMAMATIGSGVVSSEDNDRGHGGDGVLIGDEWPQYLQCPPTKSAVPTLEQFAQQLLIVAAMFLGTTVDQVIAAG